MKTFLRILMIAALSAPVFAPAAFADDSNKCTDCQDQYDNRVQSCGEGGQTTEAMDFCLQRANSNRDSCTQTCNYDH